MPLTTTTRLWRLTRPTRSAGKATRKTGVLSRLGFTFLLWRSDGVHLEVEAALDSKYL